MSKEDLILERVDEIRENQKEIYKMIQILTTQMARVETFTGIGSDNGLRGRIVKLEDDTKQLNKFKYYAIAMWTVGKIAISTVIGILIKHTF